MGFLMAPAASAFRMRNGGGSGGKGRGSKANLMSETSDFVQTEHQPGYCTRTMGKGPMVRIGAVFLLVLVGATARAEAPRRVLIVDAVTLSPALDRGNARQKMLEAVTAGVAQHGWEAI